MTTKTLARPLALAMLVATALTVPAEAAGVADRLYLAGSGAGHKYWTSDPADPEMGALSVSCGATHPHRCLGGGVPRSTQIMYFMPNAVLDEVVTLSSSTPLRFHVRLDTNAQRPYTVSFVIQRGTALTYSDAATEVSPGVFEGAFESGQLDRSTMTFFGVRVSADGPGFDMTVHTAGASWISLPGPTAVRSVPDLQSADTYRPAPSVVRTEERAFGFNDDQFELIDLDIDATKPVHLLDHALPSGAALVIGWVEGVNFPVAMDVRRGQGKAHEVNKGAATALYVDDKPIGFGHYAVTASAAPPGTLTWRVAPNQPSTMTTLKGHLLIVYGQKTLSWMRWLFPLNSAYAHRTPVSATCPTIREQVPVTEAVGSVGLSLSWDTAGLTPQRWTWSYELPGVGSAPCAENGNDTLLRLTFPRNGVWMVGATPASEAYFASVQDVRFEGDARYTYL